jgi:copper chaperone CopZ
MQKFFYVAVITLLSAACSSGTPKSESSSGVQDISSEHVVLVKFDVEGMTCEGCENAVKASVNKLEGIQEVTASHKDGESLVKFDTTLASPQSISEAITAAGYQVKGSQTSDE